MSSSTNGFTADALQTHEYQASQPAVTPGIDKIIMRLTQHKAQHYTFSVGFNWVPDNRLYLAIELRAEAHKWQLHELWKESLQFYTTFRMSRNTAPRASTFNRLQESIQEYDRTCHQAYEDTNTFLQTLARGETMPPYLSEGVVKSMRMGLQLAKLDKETSGTLPSIKLGDDPGPFDFAHLLEESVFENFSLGIVPPDMEQWWRLNRSTQGIPQNAEAFQTESTNVAHRGPEDLSVPLYHARTDTREAHPISIVHDGTRFSNASYSA